MEIYGLDEQEMARLAKLVEPGRNLTPSLDPGFSVRHGKRADPLGDERRRARSKARHPG